MKWTERQIQALVKGVFRSWKTGELVEFKSSEEKAFKKALEIVKEEFKKEKDLEKEVNQLMDDLEIKNPGSFERYKMFPLLKRQLAKQKGLIL